MKTFSQFSRERNPSEVRLVVSILNNPIISLDEEKILREANSIATEKNVPHIALMIKTPMNEAGFIKDYVSNHSHSQDYFSSLSEIKAIIGNHPVSVVCDERTSRVFYNSVIVETDGINLTEHALTGNIDQFKFGALNELREIDCKILANMYRVSNGLSEIKSTIAVPTEPIRERYLSGEIFQIGETVTYRGRKHEILDRGSNYLTLVSESGEVKKAWLQDISESTEPINWLEFGSGDEIFYKGYRTTNFNRLSEEVKETLSSLTKENTDPLLALRTIRLLDEYIATEKSEIYEKVKNNINKLRGLSEDVSKSDYKIGKDGRRYRAGKIRFANEFEDETDLKEALETKLEYHDKLNPKLWSEDGVLDPEVKAKLKEIGDAFESYLDKDGKIFDVVDVVITGSNCNYNYAPQSDIDLHLVVDIDDYCDKELIGAYMTAKKTLWNNQYDITIKGYDVELYAQDKNETLVATGVYSLKKDKWVVKPTFKQLDIDNFSVQTKACDIINQIDNILAGHGTVEDVDAIKEKIRKMRKAGLSQGGEFSVENLAFKALRNNGYFEKLNNFKQSKLDKELSLESHNGVVVDKSRDDNLSTSIMSHEDFLKLVSKLKPNTTSQERTGDNHLRIRKINYITEV